MADVNSKGEITLKNKYKSKYESIKEELSKNDGFLDKLLTNTNIGMLMDDKLNFSMLMGVNNDRDMIMRLNLFYDINNFNNISTLNKAKQSLNMLGNQELIKKCSEIEKKNDNQIDTYKRKFNFKPYENDDAIKKLYDLCTLVSPDKSLLVFSILMEAYGFKHFYGHDNSIDEVHSENIKNYNKRQLLYTLSSVLKLLKVIPINMDLTYDEFDDFIDNPFVSFYNEANKDFLVICLKYIIKHGPRYTFVFLAALAIHHVEKNQYCESQKQASLNTTSTEDQEELNTKCGDKITFFGDEQKKIIQNAIMLSMLMTDKLLSKIFRAFVKGSGDVEYVHDNQLEVHALSNDYNKLVEKMLNDSKPIKVEDLQ